MVAVDLVNRGIDGKVFRPVPKILDDLFFRNDAVMGTFPLRQRLDDTIKAMVILSHATKTSLIGNLANEMETWVRSTVENEKKEEFVAYLKAQPSPEMQERLGSALFFREIVDDVATAFSGYIYARAKHFRQSLPLTKGLGG